MVFESEKFILDPRWNRNKKCARESNAARLPPTAPRVGQRAPFAHMCRDPTPAAHVDLTPATTTSRSVVSGPICLVRAFNIVVGKMPCTRANAARCAALRVVVPSNHLRRARPVETFSTWRPQRRVNDRRADLVLIVVRGVLRVVNVRESGGDDESVDDGGVEKRSACAWEGDRTRRRVPCVRSGCDACMAALPGTAGRRVHQGLSCQTGRCPRARRTMNP